MPHSRRNPTGPPPIQICYAKEAWKNVLAVLKALLANTEIQYSPQSRPSAALDMPGVKTQDSMKSPIKTDLQY